MGAQQNFYIQIAVIGQATKKYVSEPFTLGAATQNASVWFASGLQSKLLPQAAQIGSDVEAALASDAKFTGLPAAYTANAVGLAQAVQYCDANGTDLPNVTGPTYIAPYSTINILLVDPSMVDPTVGAFFSQLDLYPQAAANCSKAKSNEAATVVLGLAPATANLDYYVKTYLAHELAHLTIFVNNAVTLGRSGDLPGVIDEGIAQLAQDVMLGQPDYTSINDRITPFLKAPQNYAVLSMNGLENGTYAPYTYGNYGAAYLLLRYVADRYGPTFVQKYILSDPTSGNAQSFSALAAAAGASSFAQLFDDFAATLAGSSGSVPIGSPYAFSSFSLSETYSGPSQAAASATVTFPGVAASALLPSAKSALIYPGGVSILDANTSVAGKAFRANDPTSALQLNGTIVSY